MGTQHTEPLREEFEKHFGKLNQNQLWAITKLAKLVRLRCKNNTAFNNAMNEVFPNAKFKAVQKTRKNWRTQQQETYTGLRIEVEGEEIKDVDESEE